MISRARPSEVDDHELVAGFRRGVEAQDLDRHRRLGFLDPVALVVEQRANLAPLGACDDDVADLESALLDEDGRNRAAPLVELGFDDDAVRLAVRVGLQLQIFGLEDDRLEQLVEVETLQRRHFHVLHVTRHGFDDDVLLEEIGPHAGRVGARLVDLVDRHDDRDASRLGVGNRLRRLRHHAVVRRHHQDDDVGRLGAAGTHRGERRVARGVEEGDLLAVQLDLIGADVLGDAAGFAGDDVGLADRVEKARLAVVDVAHDGDHRRPRDGVLGVHVAGVEQTLLDVGLGNALHGVAEFGHDQFGGFRVDDVGDLVHLPLFHEELDDVHAALGHARGKILDRDGVGDNDFAHNFLPRAGP